MSFFTALNYFCERRWRCSVAWRGVEWSERLKVRRLLYGSVGLIGEEGNVNESTITGTTTSLNNDQTHPSYHHVDRG